MNNDALIEKLLPAWKEIYQTLSEKFEKENYADKSNFKKLNEAIEKKSITWKTITISLKTAQGPYEINISTIPFTIQLGYYYNNKFIERFNSGENSNTQKSLSYFMKVFAEDVKVYDYNIKIINLNFIDI
jgi:hypothetical protein